jgi:hypothetical protein
LPSSTVITPSLPTLSIASAIVLPIDSSAFAEIAPTWAISLLVEHGLLIFFSSSTTAVTALSMPRLRSIGFMPAATYFMPSATIDCASTVAVVVPSPATSEVLDATSFTICAPMFSNLSLSSISFATDTPSFVIVGEPKLRSRHDVAALGAERDLDGVGENVDAVHHPVSGVFAEADILGCHSGNLLEEYVSGWGWIRRRCR